MLKPLYDHTDYITILIPVIALSNLSLTLTLTLILILTLLWS